MSSKSIFKILVLVFSIIILSATTTAIILMRVGIIDIKINDIDTIAKKEKDKTYDVPIVTGEPILLDNPNENMLITQINENRQTGVTNSNSSKRSNSKISDEQWKALEDAAKQIGVNQIAQGLGSPQARDKAMQDYIDEQLHREDYAREQATENTTINSYSISYILENYREMDGQEVIIEGYYSYFDYLFEYKYQVQDDPSVNIEDGAGKAYSLASYVLSANKMGIQIKSNIVNINPSALNIGDRVRVTGICHSQEDDKGTLGFVNIDIEKLVIVERAEN